MTFQTELGQSLGSHSHLERSRALSSLRALLKTKKVTADDLERLESTAVALLATGSGPDADSNGWEARMGGVELVRLLAQHTNTDTDAEAFRMRVCPAPVLAVLLEDPEVRVRKAVGELLGDMSARSSAVWDEFGGTIIDSIERNYGRDEGERGSDGACDPEDDPEALEGLDPISSLLQQSYKTVRPGCGEMRHDTEGWRCLETSFAALNAVMVGYGPSFGQYITAGEDGMDDPDNMHTILALIFKSAKHPNRFIREISQHVMGTVCDILEEEQICGPASRLRVELASQIGFGLSDNWSQVRYAASVAARKFVTKATTEEHRKLCLPLVLPQLCLNRYYVADGVRFYSQQTWQMAFGEDGKGWVARCIQTVVSYYVEQSKASNHAVREAACSCISELVSKVEANVVAPHVPRLLSCLLTSFRDASWPVRDAACLATGRCVVAFPEESREVLEKLYKLWFAHLHDNIFSVREDSAVALGDALRAYGAEAVERVRTELDHLLPKAEEQARREPIEDVGKARGDLQGKHQASLLMSSFGSLARKVATSKDCCGDYAAFRPPEPWEASDGAIYMLRELAKVAPDDACGYLPTLAALGRLTNFSAWTTLHGTIWKCLPDIAQSIGKAALKKSLDMFLEPMFRDASCGHALCETAARQCIASVSGIIGRPIFEGRLEPAQTAVFNQLTTSAHNDTTAKFYFQPRV